MCFAQDIYSRLMLVFPCPNPKSAFLLSVLASCMGGPYLETKLWELGVRNATVMALHLDFLMVQFIVTVSEMDVSEKGKILAMSPAMSCGSEGGCVERWKQQDLDIRETWPPISPTLCLSFFRYKMEPLNDPTTVVMKAG